MTMKATWNTILIILGFGALPVASVVLIYSFGAAILLGQWLFLVASICAYVLLIFILIGFGIISN